MFKDLNLFDDVLSKFSAWEVCASIDGTGPTGEYIRSGLNWETWLDNWKHAHKLQNGRNKRLNLDFTITTAGIWEIEKMFELSLEYNVTIITKQTFAFSSEVFMSCRVIPKHILQRIFSDILERIEPRATKNQKGLVDQLRHMMQQGHFVEDYPDDHEQGLIDGKEFILHMESRRKNSITMQEIMWKDKELGEWYDSI